MYAPYGPPSPSHFGSTQPPQNFTPAGTSGYTQPPPMASAAGMPGGFYSSAPPMFTNYSSPLTSPDQPSPTTAGTLSDFSPTISSIPDHYSAPLSSDSELPSQSTSAAKNTGKQLPKS
ncbi:uncharacterized protein LOC144691259 [Cetorhinus maximus]